MRLEAAGAPASKHRVSSLGALHKGLDKGQNRDSGSAHIYKKPKGRDEKVR